MEVGSGRGVAKSVVVGGGEIRRGEVGGEGFRDWRVAREFGGESRRGLQVEWRGK